MTPAWLLDIVAALMLVVAAVSAARLVAARPWRQGSVVIDTDVAHLLMAIAMAGMLTPSLATLPDTAWEVIFGLMAAWFAVRVVRDSQANGVRALAGGHCAPHLVHSAAMLYMFLALSMSGTGTATGGMGGMSGGSGAAMTLSDPTLAFAFALVLVGYSIWDLDQLSGRRYSLRPAPVSLAGVAALGIPAMAGAESGSGPLPGTQASDLTADAGYRPQTAGLSRGGGAAAGGGARGREFLLSPAVTVGCRVMMGVAMTFMLIIAI
jgi:hypothetical protein